VEQLHKRALASVIGASKPTSRKGEMRGELSAYVQKGDRPSQ